MRQSSSNGSSTETSLIRRAQAAEPAAWERLTHLYGPVVYDWARAAGLQPQDASDVTQEVFHSLTSKLLQFTRRNESDSFRGWLWTVTRNKVRDHFRHKAQQVDAIGGSTPISSGSDLPSGGRARVILRRSLSDPKNLGQRLRSPRYLPLHVCRSSAH